jgi:signal transduction histidine kinase
LFTKSKNSSQGKIFSRPALPATLLIFSILITLIAWYISRKHLVEKNRNRFEYRVHDIQSAIQSRMLAYEQVLRSGVGFFYSADTVTSIEWKKYVQTLELEKLYPGIQGLGYTARLTPNEVGQLEKNIRSTTYPDFRVWPDESRDEYFAIVYLEPSNQRNLRALGFDMYTEEKRRKAMLRARETGQPALSEMVTLVQETSEDLQKGCLLYLPVYDRSARLETPEQRRAALRGFVYSPFRINDLMKGILGFIREEIEFEIYDGNKIDTSGLFYTSHEYNPGKDKAPHSTSRVIQVAGHDWTLVFTSRKPFISNFETNQPNIIAIAGILVNLFIFIILLKINSLSKKNRILAEQFKKAEEGQRRFNEELETIVQDRTVELQRSNEDLERFAHIASHDLKEPVRKMLIVTDQLKTRHQNSLGDGMRLVDKLSKAASRLNQMIESILKFSTVSYESHKAEPVNLNNTISDVIDDLELIISEKNAQVIKGTLPVIEGSTALLHQLFYNLINNSLKFSKDGTDPVIKIEADEMPAEENLIEIIVSDNGIGFKQDDANRIFQSFFRLHSKDRFEGTGLGLALCKRIVERHSGTIEAMSSPGNGARFLIRMPKKQEGGLI